MKGIKDAHRIVVKVGTSTLTYDTGKVNLRRMDKLAQVISDLRNSGTEVALVTSAAIAVGVGKLGLSERPGDIPSRQAVATVGQCELMFMYDKLFSEYGNTIGQLLITRSDFETGSAGQISRTPLRSSSSSALSRLSTKTTVSPSKK